MNASVNGNVDADRNLDGVNPFVECAFQRSIRRHAMKKSDKTGLAQLLEHGLKDMYYAEKKFTKAFPQ